MVAVPLINPYICCIDVMIYTHESKIIEIELNPLCQYRRTGIEFFLALNKI